MNIRKVLYFANTDWYLYNFRLSLLEEMREKGWEVVLVSPPGQYGPKLQQRGFRWLSFPFSVRSANPLKEFSLIFRLIQLYRTERPVLVHHFTIKCDLYGSVAAFFAGVKSVVNSVTGMGHLFTDQGMKAGILRPFVRLFYKVVFSSKKSRVIFQNREDLNYFVSAGIIKRESAKIIRGSGVNTENFKPVKDDPHEGAVVILFASRMIKEKGINELIKAGQVLADKQLDFELHFAGDTYPENPSSLTNQDIEMISKLPWVKYHGHIDGIQTLISQSDIVALPSYREGTPRILLEAASMGKPIVATDIAGCRGVVVDGLNGFLVPVKSINQLAEALEKLITDKQLRAEFGIAGRKIIQEEFDEAIVIDKTLSVYQELIQV